MHLFQREDERHGIDADGVNALANHVFETLPASRIAYIITRKGIPLLVVEMAHRWFDVAANPVEVTGLP